MTVLVECDREAGEKPACLFQLKLATSDANCLRMASGDRTVSAGFVTPGDYRRKRYRKAYRRAHASETARPFARSSTTRIS